MTAVERAAAIGWITDCVWLDDEGFADELTDVQVVRGITRHYEGGWPRFLVDAGLA